MHVLQLLTDLFTSLSTPMQSIPLAQSVTMVMSDWWADQASMRGEWKFV